MNFRAVLFDLDGTLLDSIDGIVACFERVLEEFVPGHTYTREQMILKIGEPVPRQMFEFSGGNQALVEPMVAAYRAAMSSLLPSFPLYPGVTETLKNLKAKGMVTGIVTSKSRGPLQVSLDQHRLEKLLDVIVAADDTTEHKPLPAPLLHAAKKIQIPVKSILYVGDSVHDIRCAQAAGTASGAAYWGPFPRQILDDLRPNHGFASMAEVAALFNAEANTASRRNQ